MFGANKCVAMCGRSRCDVGMEGHKEAHHAFVNGYEVWWFAPNGPQTDWDQESQQTLKTD